MQNAEQVTNTTESSKIKPAVRLADLQFPKVPRFFWNAKNFCRGFENLMVPITTATERQLEGWEAREVWEPYWQSIQDYCRMNPMAQELISIIMAPAFYSLSTAQHRRLIERWVEHSIPGYRVLWEPDLIPQLNRLLPAYGESTVGFQFGKDGRGALPDRYFQVLVKHKFLPVGNHHDILGHFLLFTIPHVREATEEIIANSVDSYFLFERMQRALPPRPRAIEGQPAPEMPEAYRGVWSVVNAFRPAMALSTYAWNLAQEKIYFSGKDFDSGERIFSLVGAFNTVYNTTLSGRLDEKHIESTTAALGIFNANARRCIVTPPLYIRHEFRSVMNDSLSAEVRNYENVLAGIGWKANPRAADIAELSARFTEIVRKSIYAKWGPVSQPMSLRWRKYGNLIAKDSELSRIFRADSMLKIARAQSRIAREAVRVFAKRFDEELAKI